VTTVDESGVVVDLDAAPVGDAVGDAAGPVGGPPRRRNPVRRLAMRCRGVVVKAHRWLSIGLLVWLLVICVTGAWLAVHEGIDSVLHGDRYRSTDAPDVGPQAAFPAAKAALPDDASIYGLAQPSNGRGVYQVGAETETGPEKFRYDLAYVDPGTGAVNAVHDEAAGFSQWMFRGHMYLWQDHGVFGVFDPRTVGAAAMRPAPNPAACAAWCATSSRRATTWWRGSGSAGSSSSSPASTSGTGRGCGGGRRRCACGATAGGSPSTWACTR
jgi:hypothetical protein